VLHRQEILQHVCTRANLRACTGISAICLMRTNASACLYANLKAKRTKLLDRFWRGGNAGLPSTLLLEHSNFHSRSPYPSFWPLLFFEPAQVLHCCAPVFILPDLHSNGE
jgi:hypothetical protein